MEQPLAERDIAGRRVRRAAEFAALGSDERWFRAWYDAMLPQVYGYVLADRHGAELR